MLNPLAIGVTLGGQFLDIVAPRPKLRVVDSPEFSLLAVRFDSRTVPGTSQEFVGASVAGGTPRTLAG